MILDNPWFDPKHDRNTMSASRWQWHGQSVQSRHHKTLITTRWLIPAVLTNLILETLWPSLLRHKYHSSRCVMTKVTLCYSCHVMSRLTVSRDRPRCSQWWRWRGPAPSRWRRRPGRGREALLEQTALTRCSWARWVGARGRGYRCSSGVWGPPGSRHWSVR